MGRRGDAAPEGNGPDETALLRGTSLTVEEVGSAIGFSSISYFSQAFKGQFGISPNAWRTRK